MDTSLHDSPPPWPSDLGLRRSRLLEMLDRPARLTLVVAPAGHGKTTLLAQHAARSAGPVAWHRATSEDTVPGHLLQSLHSALVRAGIAPGPGLEGLAVLDQEGAPTVTLVLDDAQLLIDSAGEAELERLLSDGPRGLRTILAARRSPGLNLCRAELGSVAVITAADLRFRSWEVEDLFRDVYREPLPPGDIAALARRTDGWAACLQLFHLSTQFRPLPARRSAVAALAGGPRFARSYLARTVLDELPAELGDFLARTSVFEVLTPRRCDLLLGGTDARHRLAELERLGALSADDRGQAHRCHEVLRRHLESALREHHGTDRANREYGRAAEILEAEKATGEAVRACLRGGHWQRATQLLQRVGLRAIDAGPGQLWDDLLAPELVDEDPWLSVAVARRLAGDGRLTAAAERYRHAEELFPDPGDRERAARERRLVELWTSGRPQPHLHWLDRVRAAVARHPAAYLEPAGAGPGDRLAAALAALLSGDVPAAGAPLQAVLSQAGIGPEDAETASLVLVTRLVHALVALLSGASIDVEADRIAADADRLGATWLVRQARVLRALQVGDDAELARIGHECRTMSDAWGALLADGAARVAELHTGAPSGAVFVDLAERCAELGAGTLRAWALAAAALASAIRAEPTDAAVRAADAAGRTSAVWGVGALTALAAIPASRDPTDAESRARAHARDTGLPWPEPLAHRVVHGDRGTVGKPDPRAPSVQDPLPGPVRLRCLGSFELTVAGRTLDWSPVRPRAATAFRLLALYTPRPAHRDTLLQLWPDRPDEQARHSLQVAVSSLRNLLVPDAARGSSRMIERRGESYVLVLPPGSTADVVSLSEDLDAAERARRSGCVADEIEALARAVATYRGELLPEDGPAEWVVRERDRVRLRTAAACARLAELHLLGGDLEACADAARRGVEIDPCADASWRLLIRSCDRLGDSAAAARARRGYVDMLRDLGVPLPRAGRPPMG